MKVFSRTLFLAILVFLAVGMGSAAVLSSYGVISGTANVEGPNLYTASGNELLINEEPEGSQITSYALDGSNREVEFFENTDLNGVGWYPVQASMYVEAKLDESNSNVDEAGLELVFYYRKDGEFTRICGDKVTIDSYEYTTKQTGCMGEINETIDGFEYHVKSTNSDAYYRVKTSPNTRVEVNAQ